MLYLKGDLIMLEPLFKLFDKMITDFSWKRLFSLFLMLGVIIGIFGLFESYTNYFEYKKIEKQITLLKQLIELNNNDVIIKDKELNSIHASIKKRLVTNSLTSPEEKIFAKIPQSIWQFLTGAFFWFVLSFSYIPGMRRGDKDANNAFIGLIIVGIIAGIIGALLPTNLNKIVLYIIYPIGHFLIVSILILAIQALKKRKK